MGEVSRKALVDYSDWLLEADAFRDYAPNGLQVEGRETISRIVSGVTACQALVDVAVERGADALLVHHGYFWKGESPCVTGMKRRRLEALLANGINLIAYHLPLDAHRDLGNNAQLAHALGLHADGWFAGGQGRELAVYGRLHEPLGAAELGARIAGLLDREPLVEPGGPEHIRSLGICSGGAQGFIDEAADLGLDAFMTGEVSERTIHIARERGIHFFACGHHATERMGARALGEHLAKRFDLEHEFVDVDNPA